MDMDQYIIVNKVTARTFEPEKQPCIQFLQKHQGDNSHGMQKKIII